MKFLAALSRRTYWLAILVLFICVQESWARAGGGGGHGGGHSSGGHYSGGGGHSSGSVYYGGGYGAGSSASDDGTGEILLYIFLLFLGIIIILAVLAKRKKPTSITFAGQPFPEGLDATKVRTSFLAIQDAWQNKDLKNVRKWISDGVYQRYAAQFNMMNRLDQVNRLTNIRVNDIRVAKVEPDAGYQTADVAISFTINDEFLSKKYPSFNERFMNDSDIEYWTFIKKTGTNKNANLYANNNCPNCGAPFEIKMGEISRCASCGTLTNTAEYDWVLSEITQMDDYSDGQQQRKNTRLFDIMQNDTLFSVQRMGDIASNAFMQTMQVLTGGDAKRLTRFADKGAIERIAELKQQADGSVFDRLYLNDVLLASFTEDEENDRFDLTFNLTVTYQRVSIGDEIDLIDDEPTNHKATLTLSKKMSALKNAEKQTVYSYECPCCGAPYNDTTDDVCTYCGEPVINMKHNWVLTDLTLDM